METTAKPCDHKPPQTTDASKAVVTCACGCMTYFKKLPTDYREIIVPNMMENER